MTLRELKKMIAEEYAAYQKQIKKGKKPVYTIQEQPAGMPPMDVMDDPTIAVSDADIDVEGGGEDAEATLKDIFDMLKDYFEGNEGDDTEADDDGEDDAGADDDAEEDDDKEETLQETRRKNQRVIHESRVTRNRFKRLANIIKG